MTLELLKISAISGLIFLDSAPVGQWMISQPVVSGSLVGWLLGDLSGGLLVGILLQLIWSGRLPIGSSCPPEAPICTMVAVIIYAFVKRYSLIPAGQDWFLMIYAITCGIGAGVLGSKITIAHRHFNNRFAELSDQYAMQGDWVKIEIIPWQAVGLIWISAVVLIFTSCQIALAFYPMVYEWGRHIESFQYFIWLLLTLGLAVILDLYHFKKRLKLMIAGLIVGFSIGSYLWILGGY